MRNELIKGYKLTFPEKKEGYIIKDVLGRGASCLVYLAEVNEDNNVRYSIIKEFNPVKLDLKRDASGTLIIPDEKSEEYSILLQRFKLGYEKQQQIRIINDLTNTTSNIQGIYHTNNTEYIEMTYFNGETYSFKSEESLYDFFRRMKALTQVISNYHNAGFLHLDIKPDNVYVLPETPEMVMLFDFDSVIEKDAVVGNSPLSYTKEWASIEQIDLKRRKEICEATDLFAVGEMVFYYFFGRHSDISERRSFSKYSFDYNTDQFNGANPLIIKHLSELLHKTICNIVKNRYQTAQELIDKLDILISLSNPNEPFLKTNIPSATGFFVGRDYELNLLHDRIQDANVLFVSGIGGVGKSELVKHYAKKYVNDYDTIIFAPFVSDVFALITDDVGLPICNFKQFPEEKPEEYYARKLRKLKELCDDNVLIIIDNFDNAEELDKFLELNCKMLFTTRFDFSDVYAQIDLDALKEKQHIIDIFNNFYTKPLSFEDKEIVEEIIDVIEGHTMTVELLAKQMMAGRVSPKQMLERLTDGGIAESGKEKIRIAKDDSLKIGNAYSHIQTLFDLSELNNDETYVLANLCLIPHTGISTELFCQWCKIDNYDTINSLVNEGWIRVNKENDYVSLHPVVCQMINSNIDIQPYVVLITKSISEELTKAMEEQVCADSRKNIINMSLHVIEQLCRLEITIIEIAEHIANMCDHCKKYGRLVKLVGYVEYSLDIISKRKNTKTNMADVQLILSKLYRKNTNYAKAEHFASNALTYFLKKKEYSDKLIECYLSIGDIKRSQSNYDVAERMYKNAFDVYNGTNNDLNSDKISDIYSRLGNLYENMKRFSIGEEYLRKALEISKNLHGDKHLDVAIGYNNLGILYYKQKMFDKAIKYYLKALEIIQQYGMGHQDTLSVYTNLATVYVAIGEFKLAEKYYFEALNYRRNLFGDESVDVPLSYNQIGYMYLKQENFESAEKYYLMAFDILSNKLVEEYSLLATVCNNLGTLYLRIKSYDKAEMYLIKSLEIRKNLYGNKSVELVKTYSGLGSLYRAKKEYNKSESYHIMAIEILRSSIEKDEFTLATALKNLATLYREIKHTNKANELYEEALLLKRKYYPSESEELKKIEKILEEMNYNE